MTPEAEMFCFRASLQLVFRRNLLLFEDYMEMLEPWPSDQETDHKRVRILKDIMPLC